jgi:hypothetical protein
MVNNDVYVSHELSQQKTSGWQQITNMFSTVKGLFHSWTKEVCHICHFVQSCFPCAIFKESQKSIHHVPYLWNCTQNSVHGFADL